MPGHTVPGIPTIQYGPANTEGIHSYNENVDIEDVVNAGRIYVLSCAICWAWSEQKQQTALRRQFAALFVCEQTENKIETAFQNGMKGNGEKRAVENHVDNVENLLKETILEKIKENSL